MAEDTTGKKILTFMMDRFEVPMLSWVPYGPFIYPFLRMFVIKLADANRSVHRITLEKPIRFSSYILNYTDRNRVLTFFEKDARLLKIRARFPAKRTELKKSDLGALTRYYCVLYPILVLKRDILITCFRDEILNQEYDRIAEMFPGWHLISRSQISNDQVQELKGIWNPVSAILKETVRSLGNEFVSGKEGKTLIKNLETQLWEKLGLE